MKKKIIKNFIGLNRAALVVIVAVIFVFSFAFDSTDKARADIVTSSVTVGNTAPTVSQVKLKRTAFPDADIILTENTTTSVSVVALLTDPNGGGDIDSATATIWLRGSVSGKEACVADDTRCYVITSANCTLGTVSGNDRNVTCTTGLWFVTKPSTGSTTDVWWEGYISVFDGGASNAYGNATNSGETRQVDKLVALDVTATIGFGTLGAGATSTDAQQQTAVVTTTGNAAIDITLQAEDDLCTNAAWNGTDCPVSTDINSTAIEYSTSTNFEYRDEAGDDTALGIFRLASTSAKSLELQSATPTTRNNKNSDTSDDTFWKLGIPTGQAVETYYGTTTFTAQAN